MFKFRLSLLHKFAIGAVLLLSLLYTMATDTQRTRAIHAQPASLPVQTNICGAISETNWTIAGSPYVITCASSLSGHPLTIDAGVTVQFSVGAYLDIFSVLKVNGSSENFVIFTSAQVIPARGDWGGLRFHGGAEGSVLNYAIVEYGSGVSVDKGPLTVQNSTIRFNNSSGIYVNSPNDSTISNNTVFSNTAYSGAGIFVNCGTATITGNTITWNNASTRGGGVHAYGFCFGSTTFITLTGNTIANNSVSSYGGAGVLYDSADGIIANNVIRDNDGTGADGGGMSVGGASEPMVLITGNIISGNKADSDGAGISAGGRITITNNLIDGNILKSGSYYGAGITIHYPTHSVSCNTIVNNIALSGGAGGIWTSTLSPYHKNTISNNSGYQFKNASGTSLDATDNFWGTTDSIQIAAGITGSVTYVPFLSAPDSCAAPPGIVVPESVTIDGATSGSINTPQSFTATISPLTATPPITFIWEATGQLPITRSASRSTDSVSFNWNTVGQQIITVTASNLSGTVSATHMLTTVIVPPEGVEINGSNEGSINANHVFTATVSPISATLPLTYVWQANGQTAVTHMVAGLSDAASFSWNTVGEQAVTVTVLNQAGSATGTFTLTTVIIAPGAVTLGGSAVGGVHAAQYFTATVYPVTATAPITFLWEASGQTPVAHTALVPSDPVMFTWETLGGQVITVTARNEAGIVSTTLDISITLLNPAPILASINPTSAVAGGPSFTLTVTGTGFIAGSTLRWNGSDRVTTFISDTQLEALIPSADLATGSPATVTVFNPEPGGGGSNALDFVIEHYVYFSDNFNDGDANGWDNSGPGSWYVENHEYVLDLSGFYGVYARSVVGDSTWGDYTFEFDMRSDVGSDCLFLFRYLDSDQHYYVDMRPSINDMHLMKVINGTHTSVMAVAFPSGNGIWYHMKVSVLGPRLKVFVNENLLIDYTDNVSPITHGKIGFGGWNGARVRFDNVLVMATGQTVPLSGLAISGPAIVGINAASVFTASIVPLSATQPITYFWEATGQTPVTHTVSGLTDTTSFTWNAIGPQLITVTAQNAGAAVSATHVITIAAPNPTPILTSISPTSAVAGGSAYTLTVTGTSFVDGSIVRWNGSDRATTFITSTQLQAWIGAADLNVGSPAKVSVFNPAPGGGESNTLDFVIRHYLYLPLIMKRWPPVPDVPALNAINNPGRGPAYTVSWSATYLADNYLLQEDTNPSFSAPSTVYNGAGTSWPANGKAPGIYYYRVKASNTYGDSGWSIVQSTTVWPLLPATPTLSTIANADFDGNYQVAWNAVTYADTYTLEEDDNASFTSPATVFVGTGTGWTASSKAAATYYYRVKATDARGDSGWSGTQSVLVVPGIHGHVTVNGSPVGGVSLALRFYNGSSWSTYATTTTAGDGTYKFTSAPTLGAGQTLYVRYLNGAMDSSRLAGWWTRELTSYSAGTSVGIGDFDIANIPLGSPSSGATISLPTTFSWTRRSNTPSDSYEWDVFEPNTGSPWAAIYPLGYVNGVTINSLPSGFYPNTQYGWFVAVWSPDGGYGESYYYRTVKFTNTGIALDESVHFQHKSDRDDRAPTMEPAVP